jgi:hypothetical protein
VDEASIRSDLSCNAGLILVPKQVVERLQNDDQLAALLADGVAHSLQLQSARIAKEFLEIYGAQAVAELALSAVPGAFIAADVGAGIAAHKVEVLMEEGRRRIALTLMADAGYDPWQAPEAWRLLAPKHLPMGVATTKYPNRSGYQLGILNLQYGSERASTSATHASQTN